VQDVDRIGDIEAVSRPARHRRPRVKVEPLSIVRRAQRISLSLHLITLFVHRAMMAATQQREIRQRGGASVGPMAKVMALTERSCAAGEAAAPVSVL
jgi:hypothetical protein